MSDAQATEAERNVSLAATNPTTNFSPPGKFSLACGGDAGPASPQLLPGANLA